MSVEQRGTPGDLASLPSVALYVPVMGRGGAEMVMLRLATGFARRGIRTWLVVHDKDGALLPEVPPAVQVVDLHLRSGRALLSANTAAIRPLGAFLREHGPDVLMTPFPHANIVALAARRLVDAATRVVVSEHAPLDRALAGHSRWRRTVLQALIGRSYPRASAIVAVSEGVKRSLVALGIPGGRVDVLPNPVVPEDFWRVAAEHVEHPWFEDRSRPLVIGVGRLDPVKDFATLLRAFARVRHPTGARLVLVGDGPERAALERLAADLGISDDVWLAGFQAKPAALVAKSRVLVSSSRFEGAPLVLIEALACGCPVVATMNPGAVEMLADGLYGRLVPIGDPDAMGDAIREMLHQPPDAAPGRQYAAGFTVQHSVDRYLALFAALRGP